MSLLRRKYRCQCCKGTGRIAGWSCETLGRCKTCKGKGRVW